MSASFSHDGTRIVTASYDGTASIWDVHLETRDPETIDRIVKSCIPLRLEGETIVHVPDFKPDPILCARSNVAPPPP